MAQAGRAGTARAGWRLGFGRPLSICWVHGKGIDLAKHRTATCNFWSTFVEEILAVRDSRLRGLKTFCVAARLLSFKAAAEELCVTPSAVSHQIKTLESLFDFALFERETRGIRLTEAGFALFAQINPVLEELERITLRFQRRHGRRRILRITLLPFFASEILIPRLKSFTDRHDSIDIRVETVEAGKSHAANSDVSVLLLSEPPRELHAHKLFPLQLTPACSPAIADRLDRGDPASWLNTPLIVHKSRPKAWEQWFSANGGYPARQPSVIHLDSMFSVARAAERGLGIALVPVPLIDKWLQSRALVRISQRSIETSDRYYVVYRPEDAGKPDVCAFRDWALEMLGET